MPFRTTDSTFGGSASWDTQPECFTFQNDGYWPFSSTLLCSLRLPVRLLMQERTLLAELATCFWFVLFTHGWSAMDLTMCNVPFQVLFARLGWTAPSGRPALSKECFPSLFVCVFLSRRGGTGTCSTFTLIVANISPCTLPSCFASLANSVLSLTADGLPFASAPFAWILDTVLSFLASKLRALNLLIQKFLSPWFAVSGCSVAYSSGEYLGHTMPTRSWADQTVKFVFLCRFSRTSSDDMSWVGKRTSKSCPIVRQNLGRHHHVKFTPIKSEVEDGLVRARHAETFVDHQCNVSCHGRIGLLFEPSAPLGGLLLELLLEAGTLSSSLQRWGDPRIKRLEVRMFPSGNRPR